MRHLIDYPIRFKRLMLAADRDNSFIISRTNRYHRSSTTRGNADAVWEVVAAAS